MNPRSVAIVGASANPERVSGMPLRYLQEAGFSGEIYPINPKYDELAGLRCYPSADALPAPADLAIVALGAQAAVQAVGRLGAAGTKAAVILSAGFSEIGDEGMSLQQELRAISAETGIRLCGPNCAGLMNPHARMVAAFGSQLADGQGIPLGSTAVISQSGAFGAYVFSLLRARGIGISQWATTGNEVDLQAADFIALAAEDDATERIVLAVEEIRDGALFIAAARRAIDRGKPIICLRMGRTAEGRDAVLSHTGAIAGDAKAVTATLAELGVVEVSTVSELIDTVTASASAAVAGRRVAVLTLSGGVGALIADTCSEIGLEVPVLAQSVQHRLLAMIPFAGTRNPVDVTGNVANDPSLVSRALEVLLESDAVDAVVCFLGQSVLAPGTGQRFLDELRELPQSKRRRLWLSCLIDPAGLVRSFSDDTGLPVFEDPSRCVQAIANVLRLETAIASDKSSGTAVRLDTSDWVRDYVSTRVLGYDETMELMDQSGIPRAAEQLVHSATAATEAVQAHGGRAVLKISSADLPHKTEAGAVAVGVATQEAASMYQTLLERCRRAAPQAKIDGVLIQELVSGDLEVIVGARVDRTFGPIIAVGLGGTAAELFGRVAIRLAPVDRRGATELFDRAGLRPFLDGFRGAEPLHEEQLAELVVRVSELAWLRRSDLTDLEFNPVIVSLTGARAVDVVAVSCRPPRREE